MTLRRTATLRPLVAAAVLASGIAAAHASAQPCTLPCPPPPSPTAAPAPSPTPSPVAVAPTASPAPTAPAAAPAPTSADVTRLLALVNQHRASHGLRALRVDPVLTEVARAHSAAMAARQELYHNDALFTPEMHRRLSIAYFAENVSVARTVDEIHHALLASPLHHQNIDNPRMAVAGFALAGGKAGGLWATENFGSAPTGRAVPAAAPPAAPTSSRPTAGAAQPRPPAAGTDGATREVEQAGRPVAAPTAAPTGARRPAAADVTRAAPVRLGPLTAAAPRAAASRDSRPTSLPPRGAAGAAAALLVIALGALHRAAYRHRLAPVTAAAPRRR